VTTIYLVRHAHHDLLGRELVGRQPGVRLSAEGLRQAAMLATLFERVPVTAVLASPRERAEETAKAIAKRHALSVESADALDEVDFGQWTGRSFAALEDDREWRRFNTERSRAMVPAGETMLAVQRRVAAFLETLAGRFPDGRLVVVSHGDVIRAALLHYLGMPLDFIHRLEVLPASISVLAMSRDRCRTIGVNFGIELLFDRNLP
jgi:broad specificity phosphatase PhoE